MKKIALFSIGILAFGLFSANAQNIVIAGTYDDWTNWNASLTNGSSIVTVAGTNNFSYGGITVNGVDNPTDAGGTSVTGALEVSPSVPWSEWNGAAIYPPGTTLATFQALDGPFATSSALVQYSGTMYVTYTMPDDGITGSYWNGIFAFFNYTGNWGPQGPSDHTDLGPVSTPSGTEELYEDTIPYTINAVANLTYFQWGLDLNTDYQGTNNWYITSISVAPPPVTVTPPAVYQLYTTSNDFAPFAADSGTIIMATNDFYVTNSIDDVNGNGNTNAGGIGASGAPGSLLIYWDSGLTGYGNIASGPDEEQNNTFMQTIDPGCNTNTEGSVPAYGFIYMDYSVPASGGGSYFELGAQLSYNANGYYGNGPFWPSSTTDLGYQDIFGQEVYQIAIPYSIVAGNYYGFNLSVAVNSNYNPPTYGFHVDDIAVSSAQAPRITSIGLNGTSVGINGTNGMYGYDFDLLSTTNLLMPATSWKTVAVAVPFTGPTFNITNTITPGTPATYYMIKTVTP